MLLVRSSYLLNVVDKEIEAEHTPLLAGTSLKSAKLVNDSSFVVLERLLESIILVALITWIV